MPLQLNRLLAEAENGLSFVGRNICQHYGVDYKWFRASAETPGIHNHFPSGFMGVATFYCPTSFLKERKSMASAVLTGV
jgi:hypothetical protein